MGSDKSCDGHKHIKVLKCRGPRGPCGPPGPRGCRGPKGCRGLRGCKGATGQPGPTGQPGITGEQGERGPTGPTGQPGITGEQGEQGVTGQPGITGEQGPTGMKGATGPEGPRGMKGDTGPSGAQGITGAQGPPGPTGPMLGTNMAFFTTDGQLPAGTTFIGLGIDDTAFTRAAVIIACKMTATTIVGKLTAPSNDQDYLLEVYVNNVATGLKVIWAGGTGPDMSWTEVIEINNRKTYCKDISMNVEFNPCDLVAVFSEAGNAIFDGGATLKLISSP